VQVVGFYFCILVLARYKNENNLMRGIEGLFAFTTCEAGYSNLILGQD